MNVSDLTERDLIARIRRHLPPSPPWLTVGIGDDGAVVEPVRNRVDVLTVDALVDGVHFDRRFTPPGAIGHRALAVNLSDLAAMGAEPRLALLSMALPADLPVDHFDALAEGLAALASAHRLTVAGGNLTRTPGPLTIDITAVGTAKRRSVLRRAGARVGDLVYVTGHLGSAHAGLGMLRDAPASGHDAACVARYLRPEPRVRAGLLLGRNRAASSCIDISDGLADGVARLAEASGVGIVVDESALPIEGAARAWFTGRGVDPVQAAIAGGDDYELLFTVRPRQRGRLRQVAASGGVPLTCIGVCTAGTTVLLKRAGTGDLTPMPEGFSHFR